ncbi:MAG: TIGR04255 family protein [Methylococcales bacterium]
MNNKIPKRLKKEPLIESLWEIRFSSTVSSVAELLPGLLYRQFEADCPTVEPLPTVNVPLAVRQIDQNFRYLPTMKLEGAPYSIQIGEHVVSLSCRRPYTGWPKFGSKILELAKALKDTKLLTNLERFSMKYIDVLPMSGTPTIAPLSATISLGGHDIGENSIHLRSERSENEFINIVQIMSPTEVKLPGGEKFNGILIDIDTVYLRKSADLWINFDARLNEAHDINKKVFFELLRPETLEGLEPEY